MTTPRRIAVVGGSLAGLRSAEQLRALGHTGPITVFSAERHLPYNRPPLSKEALVEFIRPQPKTWPVGSPSAAGPASPTSTSASAAPS
jgi:Pyridine nucleotide-disulphide oxidoreductase